MAKKYKKYQTKKLYIILLGILPIRNNKVLLKIYYI